MKKKLRKKKNVSKGFRKVRAELEKANDEEKAKLEIQVKNLEENLRQAEEKWKEQNQWLRKQKLDMFM